MQSIRKNNSMKNILNAVSGITLIALVVTIVVLLILASVSITVVFGDNGILQLAKEAGEKTNEAVKSDLQDIQNLEDTIGDIVNNGWSISKVTAVTSADGKIVPVPKGFVASKIKGENTVSDGFVIYEIPEGKNPNWEEDKNKDEILDVQQDYNQFVWVPADGVGLEYKQDKETWKNIEYNYDQYNDCWSDEEKIEERKASVKKYGGFYVGRYEAGVPESNGYDTNIKYQDKVNENNRNNPKIADKDLPVSKKGLQSWNFVNQTTAKTLSERMYEDSPSITSRLIDSYAWDTICTWLSDEVNVTSSVSWGNYANVDKNYTINGLYSIHKLIYDPWELKVNEGNYSKGLKEIEARAVGSFDYDVIELATGISERNKAKNIYDFAGNMFEYTTEIGIHQIANGEDMETHAVVRGGSFNEPANLRPAVVRHGGIPIMYLDVGVGFRTVLYLI